MPVNNREKGEMHILNVRLTPDVIVWIDSLVRENIYSNRSEAVREFIREYLRNNR